jgi:hypothetical protein
LRVFVWLKIERPDEQPPLRFGIEGRLNGQIYIRPATVGAKADSVSRPPLKDTWAWYCLQIEDLPASGLTDLRVVFHLAGKGEIWSDDVQVVDRWFERAKRKGLGLSASTDRVADLAVAIRKESGGDEPAYAREYLVADIIATIRRESGGDELLAAESLRRWLLDAVLPFKPRPFVITPERLVVGATEFVHARIAAELGLIRQQGPARLGIRPPAETDLVTHYLRVYDVQDLPAHGRQVGVRRGAAKLPGHRRENCGPGRTGSSREG